MKCNDEGTRWTGALGKEGDCIIPAWPTARHKYSPVVLM